MRSAHSDRPLALSIDIGTSSTRILLWDTSGREVEGVHAQVQYQMRTTADGGMEMDPELLLAHLGECMDAALSQAGSHSADIRVVGISAFWHAVLGVDELGKPITPIYNWADNRSAAVARRLRKDLDAEAIHRRTGCVLHPSYYPAKLVWLRESCPELYNKARRWQSPSEYLFGRLFGEKAVRVSTSMASATGLFNQIEQRWDTETLRILDLHEESFSQIVDLLNPVQGLEPEFSKRWPALKDTPFYPAVGDGACGNVGSGCVTPESFAINLGTSGAIRAVFWEGETLRGGDTETGRWGDITVPEGLWRYRVDAQRPIVGAAFSDGGHVYAWMCRTLQLPQGDELEKQIAAMEPGAEGLTFLPFLAGERSMGWNPDARASLSGMHLDTSPVEILRAAMEAVALQFALAANRLRSMFPEAKHIVGSGGALGHSRAWCKMFADAVGSPLTLAAEPEASSRGAALLAMEAAGIIGKTADAKARMGDTIEPDAAAHQQYQEILERQQKVYEAMRGAV